MFSDRIHRMPLANRLSALLQQKHAQGALLADLTESNPTRSGFHYDWPEISRALARPASRLYEPAPQGLAVARQAIAGYYRERALRVDPESLVLASGTSEAYGYLFKLLADPGTEVLVPVPGYPLLEVLTSLDAVRLVPYRQLYDEQSGWQLDLERLENTISNRTRAIAAVSPNNPTGAFLKKRELSGIVELCRRFDLALIVDEVFGDYAEAPDPERVPSAADQEDVLTFVLNGFSKILGLPQLKLAWIHVSGPAPLRREALEGLEFIADAYLSVSTPVQQAAPVLLGQRESIQAQIQARLRENSSVLSRALQGVPSCRVLRREGGWYAVLRLADDLSDEQLCLSLLAEDDVLVHPGYFYDFPSGSHLVLSLLTPGEVFRRGTQRLAARLKAGGPGGRVGP